MTSIEHACWHQVSRSFMSDATVLGQKFVTPACFVGPAQLLYHMIAKTFYFLLAPKKKRQLIKGLETCHNVPRQKYAPLTDFTDLQHFPRNSSHLQNDQCTSISMYYTSHYSDRRKFGKTLIHEFKFSNTSRKLLLHQYCDMTHIMDNLSQQKCQKFGDSAGVSSGKLVSYLCDIYQSRIAQPHQKRRLVRKPRQNIVFQSDWRISGVLRSVSAR